MGAEARKRAVLLVVGSFFLLLVAFLIGIGFGAVRVPPIELIRDLLTGETTVNTRIFLYVRLPRVLATLLAGAALAVSGVIIQSVLNNSLAAPNIIGVNAGAGFFTVLCIALFPSAVNMLPAAAFLGALTAVMIVYTIASETGASRMTIILAGIAIASLLNAGTDTVITFFPDVLSGITSFRMGGVARVTLAALNPAWIFICAGILSAMVLSHDLNILALGTQTAASLGMNVRLMRFAFLTVAALLAGAAVSFSGLIGFVGLIVPHMAKKLAGNNDNRLIIPVSAMIGAGFLTICDLLSRVVFAPFEIPLGIVVSYIGVPFFIYLIIRRKGGRHVD
jgi:iron complex transport system permease protein